MTGVGQHPAGAAHPRFTPEAVPLCRQARGGGRRPARLARRRGGQRAQHILSPPRRRSRRQQADRGHVKGASEPLTCPRPTDCIEAVRRAFTCYTGSAGVVEYRPAFQVWRVQQPGASGHVFNPACGSAALRCTISTPVYSSSSALAMVTMRLQQLFHRMRAHPLTREAQDSERNWVFARVSLRFCSPDRAYAACITVHTSPQRSWNRRR